MGATTPWDDPKPDRRAYLARLEAGGREADEQERADALAADAESKAIEDARIARERRAAEYAASAEQHARAIEDAAARAARAEAEAQAARAVVAEAGAAAARTTSTHRWARAAGRATAGTRRDDRPRPGDRPSARRAKPHTPSARPVPVRGRFGMLLAVAAVVVPFLGHPAALAAVLGGLAGVAAIVLVWSRDRDGRALASAPLVVAAVTVVATIGIGIAVARLAT